MNNEELPVGREQLRRAEALLEKYRAGRQELTARLCEDELWWRLRHWDTVRDKPSGPKPASAWLFNAILNKHADAMDNYPEPVVLPREEGDRESAETLSQVLPVVLELCRFEQTYSDNWWEKLKHGTAAYGVFWNAEKENGLGDVDVRPLDLLKLYWEPGISDIQDSANLFLVELVARDELKRRWPQYDGKDDGPADLRLYAAREGEDTSDKALVVDWYYKLRLPSGRTVVHYCKFVGGTLLYASENDPALEARGYYDHGCYPVVLDVLFPEKNTPAGFGYVAICKDPQMVIDALSANIVESSLMATKKRFFISASTGVNEEEFCDWSRPLVHVEGGLDDARIREIVTRPPDPIYATVIQMKIEEMKDTAANRDVNAGSVSSGVTAASAIAALQEAGSKSSRDMIGASYRAHAELCRLVVELMAQFYDEARSFRITGAGGTGFTALSGRSLRSQPVGAGADGQTLYRRPVFDLKIRARKKNPFSRMEENERAKELYSLGFFDPRRADQALMALQMMDFEGVDQVRQLIARGKEQFQGGLRA